MNLPKFSPQTLKYLKIGGIGLAGIVVGTIVITFIGSAFQSFRNGTIQSPLAAIDSYQGKSTSGLMYGGEVPELSVRNIMPSIAPMPPVPGGSTVGKTAENFEVTDYYANIETRDLANTCKTVLDLKPKSYVIFENSTDAEHSCSYTFKVEREHTDEIVSVLKGLQPKDFTVNTQTIQNTVDDFTSQIDILKSKQASIEKTLSDAANSYDEIAALATKTQNVDALAKIIDSKLQMLQQLTQERININEQLDQLTRAKADQLDKIKYTFFSVNIFENKYIDKQSLSDSWKATIKAFVNDMNSIAQNVSVNLVALLFFVLQYLIYFFILLFAAKYVWRWTKKIWKI